MINFKKIIFIFAFFLLSETYLFSQAPHFLDFKSILNESNAGKKAQKDLKTKLEKGIANIRTKEKVIQEEEKKIIQQKKILSPEDYKKKVTALREKVSKLQKERQNILTSVANDRKKARDILLKNLNPILQEYMVEKKIRMIIDKKSLLLADENLNITNDVMNLLNKKLKSINFN